MGIISWIVMGLVVGLLAKFIMPGKDPGGIIITVLLGIGGGLLGGYIGTLLGLGSVTGFDLRSILIATGGAVIILILYRLIKKSNNLFKLSTGLSFNEFYGFPKTAVINCNYINAGRNVTNVNGCLVLTAIRFF